MSVSIINKPAVSLSPEDSPAYIDLKSHARNLSDILANIHHMPEKINISFESFRLNDSFNNEYNVPIYIKIIKSVNNERELRLLMSEFLKYTEEYKNGMEKLCDYAKNSGIYDNGTIRMCNILEKRCINLNNYWTSFEKRISEYMKVSNLDKLLDKIKEFCSKCLSELISTFVFDYCFNNNNELSIKLINIFNKYLKNLGVSTFNVTTESSMDYDFYKVNEDSSLYVTRDENKMDMISNIHHYAYVFANNHADKSQMSIIAWGDVSVYCYS